MRETKIPIGPSNYWCGGHLVFPNNAINISEQSKENVNATVLPNGEIDF